MSAVYIKYTNKRTGHAFYTAHECIDNRQSFLRKCATIAREIGADAKCRAQEISEEAYRAATTNGKAV